MEAIPTEMVDHYLIDRLVREYSHGCDRLDEVRMAAAYAKESFDDHGRFRSSGQQFAHDVLAYQVDNGVSMCSHHLGQSLVKIDGDIAGAETYFIATLQGGGEDKPPPCRVVAKTSRSSPISAAASSTSWCARMAPGRSATASACATGRAARRS